MTTVDKAGYDLERNTFNYEKYDNNPRNDGSRPFFKR